MKDSAEPVTTSSQVSPQAATPDDTMPISQTPKMVSTPTTLPTKTPGPDMCALPEEVILLQEEMNRVMGHLVTTRASMDACHRTQVSDTEAAFCENNAEAMETIRKAQANCTVEIWEAKPVSATAI